MSEPRRILLAGATGLVGQRVMEAAVGCSSLRLVALSRREAPMPPGAKMEMLVADPPHWKEAVAAIAPEAVICALGTTWRKAGSEEAFRAVDQDLVLSLARSAKEAGAKTFVLVSSTGADLAAKAFYLRVKAEVEAEVARIGFDRLDILRPGLLRGQRGGDRRWLERLGILVSPLTDQLLHGRRRPYRSIDAGTVAAAALQCSLEKARGRFVHDNDALMRLVRRFESASSPTDSARRP
ncbi:MAG TPA: NAD(P)H-binding protein [Croceibacterium sp.]|nr:NAD(P)H-binding protein [Croceibacterium sp.]